MKRWCFARAPYLLRNEDRIPLGRGHPLRSKHGPVLGHVLKERLVPDGQAFHIALEMKVKDENGGRGGLDGPERD